MTRNTLLGTLKKVYLKLPVSAETKAGLKNLFFHTFAFALKNSRYYQIWYASQHGEMWGTFIPLAQGTRKFVGLQERQPGKIAIQLHLYYIDLINDFAEYLEKMPFAFDLLVSIVDADKQAYVEDFFRKRDMRADEIIVRVVPNRGRDVAPFIVGFRDLLGKYDFIAHIHSKKSLYTGQEQAQWRDYLLDNLLGSEEIVRKIFYEFVHNKDLGVVYPAPAGNVPYAGFTWLSNRAVGTYLLHRLNIAGTSMDYFDFPAGTMFWARSRAIYKLFSSGIELSDFPEENRQNDGTLAHAVERSILFAAKDAGMDYYETDFAHDCYSVNFGQKSMWQYYQKSREDIGVILQAAPTISFDIFDTLIIRRIVRPEYVNHIIEYKVTDLLGRSIDFTKNRLAAETMLRDELSKDEDCTLTDIYTKFAELTGISAEECKKIKELEVAEEVKLCYPRPEMVTWLKRCKQAGKRVVLISDTYLESEDMERILDHCGITGYDAMYLSSETNLRKDTAAVWDAVVKQGRQGEIFHIGDNEHSDWQLAADRGIQQDHVLSSLNVFSMTIFGNRILSRYDHRMSNWGAIVTGTVLNRLFADPFLLNESRGRYNIRTLHDLGYMLYGPVLFTYIIWLRRMLQADQVDTVLFLAREGYFLQKLYETISSHLGEAAVSHQYFYTSRRSITVASLKTAEDIRELLALSYEGNVHDFFRSRYGIHLSEEEEDFDILLPEDAEKKQLVDVLKRHQEEILANAAREREGYLQYIAESGIDFDRNTALVDIGYAGTIQYYLMKLMGKSMTGYYICTDDSRFKEQHCLHGCFGTGIVRGSREVNIYAYQLLLEAVLTAPDGQFLHFDKTEGGKLKPCFGEIGEGQRQFQRLEKIYEGVEAFCCDVLAAYDDVIDKIPLDTAFVDDWWAGIVQVKGLLADDLRDVYVQQDDFCNTSLQNLLDFYQERDAQNMAKVEENIENV